jgi:hypothetical protein
MVADPEAFACRGHQLGESRECEGAVHGHTIRRPRSHRFPSYSPSPGRPRHGAQSRFVIIGMSWIARMLFVVFAERGERIRIISARRANAAQRKKYEEDT